MKNKTSKKDVLSTNFALFSQLKALFLANISIII